MISPLHRARPNPDQTSNGFRRLATRTEIILVSDVRSGALVAGRRMLPHVQKDSEQSLVSDPLYVTGCVDVVFHLDLRSGMLFQVPKPLV